MDYLPYEGVSYFVDSDNFYHFNAIVPYSTYNYRVEVISPVSPLVAEIIDLPTITLAEVKKWVSSFNGLISSVDDELYQLFLLLRDIAKTVIVYSLCGDKQTYIRAISYYVAHHMELHLKTYKDQQDKMTTSREKKNETDDIEEIKITLVDNHYGNYKQTLWGQMFWSVYGHLSKFNIAYAVY